MTTEKTKRDRPFGVTVIIFLQFALILLLVAELSGVLKTAQIPNLLLWNVANAALTLVLGICIIIVQIIIAFGLWRLKRWAWFWVMIQLGLVMGNDLWFYFNGQPSYPSMVVAVMMVFYLNQHEVQQAFQQKVEEPGE